MSCVTGNLRRTCGLFLCSQSAWHVRVLPYSSHSTKSLAHIREFISRKYRYDIHFLGSKNRGLVFKIIAMTYGEKGASHRLVSAWWMIISTLSKQEFNYGEAQPLIQYGETDVDITPFIVEKNIVQQFSCFSTNSASTITERSQLFAHDLFRSSILHSMHQLTIGWMSFEYRHLHLSYASIAYILIILGGLNMAFLSKPRVPNSNRPNFPFHTCLLAHSYTDPIVLLNIPTKNWKSMLFGSFGWFNIVFHMVFHMI